MSREEIESLENAYFMAFSDYSDRQIKAAGQKYLQEGEFFPPRPKEIISRITDIDKGRHQKDLRERYTCVLCRERVSAITEGGVCLDCTGVPKPTYKNISLPKSEKSDFKIEGRRKCQECGKVDSCIKEPIDHGPWRCADCYRGFGKQVYIQRWRELSRMIEERGFVPEWANFPPF